ncbi:hypothetical protein DFW101_1325 [Solidesulfovibrio carbinoliphilus subsp. oakridgensis]|uniref:Uncharacterized protein n=1 Tax=Solidesulfovibrio carbinoliphilus subsp. oakridgensis TaxID=694327 RepID=G7Q7M5_9BACT|nr:PPC domain-containing protein [Solidesulfovibrio carbinoliphilus]EHJ47334.1 hypothetical protein DFW101_1325 [Solidesulfovibrio carbinoliphilus subsp. oakridgensis]
MNLARSICAMTFAVVALCPAGLLSPNALQAKDMKPIAFATGANSASFKGDIEGMDRDIYPVTAKAGQTMKVTVTNKLKLVLFHLQLPGKAGKYLPGAGEDDDATTWQGTLPESGTYKIIVGAMRGKDTTYTLDVAITN